MRVRVRVRIRVRVRVSSSSTEGVPAATAPGFTSAAAAAVPRELPPLPREPTSTAPAACLTIQMALASWSRFRSEAQ